MIKQSDLADVMAAIKDRASTAGGALSGGGAKLMDFYSNATEGQKALIRGMGGAAVGGLVAGGLASRGKKDPEERVRVLGPALMGALLGGGAAAGLPAGLKMLGGDLRLPGEPRKSITSKVVDGGILRPAYDHAGVLLAGGGWAAANKTGLGQLAAHMNDLGRGGSALTRMRSTLADKNLWKQPGVATAKSTARGAKRAPGLPVAPRLGMLALALGGGYLADRYKAGKV